jgi:ketosteroid isomerase-like protein
MSEDQNVELVRRLAERWNAGDRDAVWAMFHDDAITESSPAWFDTPKRQSLSEMQRSIGDFASSFDDLRVEVIDIRGYGERVLARGAWTARGATSGVATRHEFWVVYTIEDGKVRRTRWFNEEADALAAVAA